jgi:hypothetical protein
MQGETKGHSLPEGVQPPFTVEEHPEAFVVRSAEGRQLAWSIRASRGPATSTVVRRGGLRRGSPG